MKKFNVNTFCSTYEVTAMADFLSTRWNMDEVTIADTSTKGMHQFVETVFEMGMVEAKDWIGGYDTGTVHTLCDMRSMFLQNQHPNESEYTDVIRKYIDGIWMYRSNYRDYVTNKWDYGDRVSAVMAACREMFDGLDALRPNGYTDFVADYDDFDGQEEYYESQQQIDEDEFNGFNGGASTLSFPLPARVAMSYVAYDDICQGRSPLNTLVSAIFAQGLAASTEVNDAEIDEAVRLLNITQPYSNDPATVTFINSPMIEKILTYKDMFPAAANFVCATDVMDLSLSPQYVAITKSVQKEKSAEENVRRLKAKAEKLLETLKKETDTIIHNSWSELYEPNGLDLLCAVVETSGGELLKMRFDADAECWTKY